MNTSTSTSDSSTKARYGRQIFASRVLSAIIWSIILQCVYVSYVLFLMNNDILHPMIWIKNACASITNLGTWFYLIPLGVMTFAQGVLQSKEHLAETTYVRTRFGSICNFFRPRHLLMALLNMVFGGMIVSYYSALLGEDANIFMQKCGGEYEKCLNEQTMYMIASGVWIGLYTSLKRHLWETKVVLFPIIQQRKYTQIKMKIGPLVMQSLKEAVLPHIFFCLLYWWCGGYLRDHLSGFLGVPTNEDYHISLLFWMKPFLAMRCLLFSAIIILASRTMEMLYEVFLTEHCYFPITSTITDNLNMNDALASSLPLMKRLAYLDLLFVSERDPIRQGELFSLSVPGGHPHNWNGTVLEVLGALEAFTSSLSAAICDINRASNGPLLPSSPIKARSHKDNYQAIASQVAPTSPTLRLRNMSLFHMQDTSIAGSHPLLHSSENVPTRQTNNKDLIASFKQQLSNVIQWIRRKPGISYFFGEIEDAQARHLLLHNQHLSWGAQALAHLAAASLKRDTYGVVQKDLPAIFKSLLQMKNVLERLPLQSHKRALRHGSLDLQMKIALTSAAKRSLYILCTSFSPYLTDLPLSEDLRQALAHYIMFKEG